MHSKRCPTIKDSRNMCRGRPWGRMLPSDIAESVHRDGGRRSAASGGRRNHSGGNTVAWLPASSLLRPIALLCSQRHPLLLRRQTQLVVQQSELQRDLRRRSRSPSCSAPGMLSLTFNHISTLHEQQYQLKINLVNQSP